MEEQSIQPQVRAEEVFCRGLNVDDSCISKEFADLFSLKDGNGRGRCFIVGQKSAREDNDRQHANMTFPQLSNPAASRSASLPLIVVQPLEVRQQ